MSFQISWEKVFTLPREFHETGSAGIRRINETTLVAGLTNSHDDTFQLSFYESLNGGDSWQHISDVDFDPFTESPRFIHFPGNVLAWAFTDIDDHDLFVHRSTNGGHSWSTVTSYNSPGNHQPPRCIGGCTFNRTSGALVGMITVNNLTNRQTSELIYTVNSGASWTNYGLITPGGANDRAQDIAAKPNSFFRLAAAPGKTYNANPLTTWAAGATAPGPGGNSVMTPYDCVWLTDTDLVLAGFGQGGANEHFPYVYWSNNAATTWTAVPASDIAGWPTSGVRHPGVRTLKRLTRDSIALGTYITDGSFLKPVIISIDSGHTYPHAGTGWSFLTNDSIVNQGSMANGPAGRLLCCLDISNPTAHSWRTEIWRGTPSC